MATLGSARGSPMTALRRFNDAGVAAFRAYLGQLREDSAAPPPMALLEDGSLTELQPIGVTEAPPRFSNRLEFAQWLTAVVDNGGSKVSLRDVGFWSWLALLLFDQVCPVKGKGRSVGA